MKTKQTMMAKVILLFFFSVCVQPVFPGDVKVVNIPDDVKVEENTAKETLVRNISQDEIYQVSLLRRSDDFLYLVNTKPLEIVKLNLDGKIAVRYGKEGQGPREFLSIYELRPYKGNIAVLDGKGLKMAIYTENLEFVKETKLKTPMYCFFIDKNNNFYFYYHPTSSHYFDVYSENFEFLRKFSKTIVPDSEKQKNYLQDLVWNVYYIPEKDGIWACFRNRYDLRYYRKETLKVEIKAKNGFFKSVERKSPSGIKVVMFMDRGIYLSGAGDRLYYFYLKDWKVFCDVFDLTGYRLLRRIRLNEAYQHIVHYKGNIFYALRTGEEGEVKLFKIEI